MARIKSDVCRSGVVPTDREQLDQLIRLLEAESKDVKLKDHSPNMSDVREISIYLDDLYCYHCSFLVTADFLSATGELVFGTASRDLFRLADKIMLNRVVRAVYQPAQDWECVRWPDDERINAILEAFEPESGWRFHSLLGKVMYFLVNQGTIGAWNSSSNKMMTQLSSAKLRHIRNITKKENTVFPDRREMVCESISRIIRPLPHLILLAGGKIRWL